MSEQEQRYSALVSGELEKALLKKPDEFCGKLISADDPTRLIELDPIGSIKMYMEFSKYSGFVEMNNATVTEIQTTLEYQVNVKDAFSMLLILLDESNDEMQKIRSDAVKVLEELLQSKEIESKLLKWLSRPKSLEEIQDKLSSIITDFEKSTKVVSLCQKLKDLYQDKQTNGLERLVRNE